MSQLEKAIAKLTRVPPPKDYGWAELQRVMRHFGYEEIEGAGSRVKFVNFSTKHKILLHKRHPDSTLIGPQLADIIESLTSQGCLP